VRSLLARIRAGHGRLFEDPQGDIIVGRIQIRIRLGLPAPSVICRGFVRAGCALHNPRSSSGRMDMLPDGNTVDVGVINWAVRLAGMDVKVARGVKVGAGVAVDPNGGGAVLGVCSRPISNVPRQAVMARKKTLRN